MTAVQMQEHCKIMMEHKKSMAADLKAQDAALTEMVAKMNRTSGAEQMPLMAAAITQMAEQRVAGDAHMATMNDEMMQHMRQHMQMGKDSMAQSPMMNEMKNMDGMAGMKSKAEEVRRRQQEGRVVAMGTGTDVAMESAHVTLVKGDLRGASRSPRASSTPSSVCSSARSSRRRR